MTLKGLMARGTGFETTEEAPKPIPPAAPMQRTVSPSTSVDAASELEGRLRCKQTLRIDGCIKGEIECERTVIVGECAKIYASIDADEVQIAGVVEGDIAARRKIVLERTAVVVGDLTTPGIVIEEGAKLKGRIVIGSEAQDAAAKSDGAKKAAAIRKASAGGEKTGDAPATHPVAVSA